MLAYVMVGAVVITVALIVIVRDSSSSHWKVQTEQRLYELEINRVVVCREMGQVQYLINCIALNPFVTSDAVVTVGSEDGVETTRVILKDHQPLVFLNAQPAELSYSST